MHRLIYSTTEGLGALVAADAERTIIGMSLFGGGLDGRDLILVAAPRGGGGFTMQRQVRAQGAPWPSPAPDGIPAGSCQAFLTEDLSALHLRIEVDRAAIGGQDSGFSPPPPERIVRELVLARL